MTSAHGSLSETEALLVLVSVAGSRWGYLNPVSFLAVVCNSERSGGEGCGNLSGHVCGYLRGAEKRTGIASASSRGMCRHAVSPWHCCNIRPVSLL